MRSEQEITVKRIGKCSQPLVIIDDFFPEAGRLRDAASQSPFVPALNFYPGIRAQLPNYYWSDDQMIFLHHVIQEQFGLSGAISVIDSSFSIVTTPRNDLKFSQRIPHSDAFSPNQIALIHYLSPGVNAGTAFYRHRMSRLERIEAHNRKAYFELIETEFRLYGPPEPDYIHSDTHMFERVDEVPGKFNRALLYLGQQLHSGAIYPDTPLVADPLAGRLTVTAFMTVE